MLPIFRQRLMMAAAVVVGGLVWLLAEPALAAADGSSGITLLDGRIGVVPAVMTVLLAGLPAIALGVVVAAVGHPLSGVFVVSCALAFLAGDGGAIDGWMWRHEDALPGAYLRLVIEAIGWAAALAGLAGLLRFSRPHVRPRLGRLATDDHFGHDTELALPGGRSLLAGAMCALIGGILANLLIQTTDPGQVIGSLILSFTLASLVAQMIVPQVNPMGILLSPMVVGLAAYAYVLTRGYPTGEAVLHDWYTHRLWGLALVLPIHYVSAGVVGCTIGLGLAQSLDRARTQPVEA